MYSAEFFATFMFVLSILCITSIEGLNKFQIAIAIGLSLSVAILLSIGLNKNAKSHLNPAVTTAFAIKGELHIKSFFILILLQFLAALLAFAVFTLFRSESINEGFKYITNKFV